MSGLSLVIIDNHCILRDGLVCLLESVENFSVVGSFAKPSEVSECLGSLQVDVVIMELLYVEADALRCIADWSSEYPSTKVIVLSQFPEDVYAERVLKAGAAGYLMKDAPSSELITALRKVHAGEVAVSPEMSSRLLSNFSRWRKPSSPAGDLSLLSDREMLVLTLIGQGQPTSRIAETMGVSKKTVSTFKERIKVKLSLSTGLQLTQIAMEHFGRSI